MSPSPVDIGRQVSLYAFNDWTLGLCRLGPRPFLHTIARTAAAGPFRSGHRGAKKPCGSASASRSPGRMGEIAGAGVFDLVPPVRQERGRAPPVPADAALRGAHRGAGGGEEEVERIFEVPSFTYDFPYASNKLPVFAVQRRRFLPAPRRHRRPAHAGQGRQRGRRRDRQRDRHHHRRADHERHRRRRLLHPVGRQQARRPQRLGPFAGADDARPVRGPGQHAEHAAGAASPRRARCRSG